MCRVAMTNKLEPHMLVSAMSQTWSIFHLGTSNFGEAKVNKKTVRVWLLKKKKRLNIMRLESSCNNPGEIKLTIQIRVIITALEMREESNGIVDFTGLGWSYCPEKWRWGEKYEVESANKEGGEVPLLPASSGKFVLTLTRRQDICQIMSLLPFSSLSLLFLPTCIGIHWLTQAHIYSHTLKQIPSPPASSPTVTTTNSITLRSCHPVSA